MIKMNKKLNTLIVDTARKDLSQKVNFTNT